MSITSPRFSDHELIEILSLSPNATAVYTTENIIIQMANDAMIRFWGKDRGVIGKPMLEVIPELEGQPFIAILKNVWNTGEVYEARDTRAELVVDGELQEFYFDFIYRPLKDAEGNVYCILHTATDVTQQKINQIKLDLSRQNEQLLFEELAATNEELAATNDDLGAANTDLLESNDALERSQGQLKRLIVDLAKSETSFKDMIMQAPVAISLMEGRDLVIKTANKGILDIWGKDRSILGKPVAIALPELKGQPFLQIMDDVYTSGKPYYGYETKAYLERNNVLEENYFNFVYHPIKNSKGVTEGIMTVATKVTEQIIARKRIEDSENRLHRMVVNAPIGMTVLKGRDLVIEIANNPMLKIWNRKEEQVIGRTLMSVFPELVGQPFPRLLHNVFDTGKPIAIDEIEVNIANDDGTIARKIVNFTYDPLYDLNHNVESILATVIDVTEQVESRRELLQVQERGRLAIMAAKLGTFDMDFSTGKLAWDERCRQLFGVYHRDEVTYEGDFVKGLHPDDRQKVLDVIELSMNKKLSNGDYDVEYRTVGAKDRQIRWVRATGKVFFDEKDVPLRFIGAVLDITAQKQDEQRKNDFIAMVSHELKTPLTSLKAYIQMLTGRARKQDDAFTFAALDKVNRQVNKMTVMINGFLNVSRLEAGKIHLEKRDFNLDELIRQTVDDITLTAGRHHIIYQSIGFIEVNADSDKIGQVIHNFLSNAMKYSSTGKDIVVTCSIDGGEVRVNVRDEGMGISLHNQEKLFERFYRVDTHETKTISGFGIGLYLCAEIIRRHEGQIGVESDEGKGSTFFFTLPLNK
jgi:PAS domain S-box-containing protein